MVPHFLVINMDLVVSIVSVDMFSKVAANQLRFLYGVATYALRVYRRASSILLLISWWSLGLVSGSIRHMPCKVAACLYFIMKFVAVVV